MCEGGGQREYITLSVQLSYPEAPATLTPLSFVYFFPSVFLVLCVYLVLSAYSGFISLCLSILVVIFTKRLVKGSARPQIWIRFAQGLGLCLVLFALRGVRRVRAREGIS